MGGPDIRPPVVESLQRDYHRLCATESPEMAAERLDALEESVDTLEHYFGNLTSQLETLLSQIRPALDHHYCPDCHHHTHRTLLSFCGVCGG